MIARVWCDEDERHSVVPDPNGVFDGAVFHQVIPTINGYLAIGDREIEPNDLAAAIWWSADARTWTRVGLDAEMVGDDASIFDATLTGNAVVMVGAHNDWNRSEPVVWFVRPG